MADARVIHFVLGNVSKDARVRKSGRALRDLGYRVIYVGEARDPLLNKARFFRGEDIDNCPHYIINDGRRVYDSAVTRLNRLNPLFDPREKIKTSILRALRDNDAKLPTRLQTLSLVPAYAVCFAMKGLDVSEYWDRLRGVRNRGERLFSELKNLEPDLIHAHDLSAFALIAPYCRSNGIKLIYDSHELERGRNAPRWTAERRAAHAQLEADSIQSADAVITVSESIGRILEDTYAVSKPVIVPNAPPKANIRSNTTLRERLGLPEDHKVILYLGGIMPGRGIDTLFRLLEVLPENVNLAFLGAPVRIFEATFEEMLQNAASLRSRIHLLGHKPYTDVIHEAYGADVGYNAIELSCESYENALPNKFFEYVFAKVPVISTPQADVVQLTEAYGLGNIVPDGDFDALHRTIESMLLGQTHRFDPELHEKFIETFCWENQSQKLAQLYADLL